MKLNEILLLFKQGKSTARSHMKNLIEMAIADGNIDNIEYDLLKKIAKRNKISGRQLKQIQENPSIVEFEVPVDAAEKFHQLYDLVHMMVVDKEVHAEERKLCNIFAAKFGYQRSHIEELINTIQSNIETGHDHNNTMKRVNWMLDLN